MRAACHAADSCLRPELQKGLRKTHWTGYNMVCVQVCRWHDADVRWIGNTDTAALPSGAPVNVVPIHFTKSYLSSAADLVAATICIAVDNQAEVLLNSVSLGEGIGWLDMRNMPSNALYSTIKPGNIVLEVCAE